MTNQLIIDKEKCNKCGWCEKACGLKIIELKGDYPTENLGMCNRCGHCVAICPTNAIQIKDVDMNNFLPIQDPGISYEQYYTLVRNRKSIRNYQPKPISEDHIKKIIESVRYVPTGANRQRIKYIIITDPANIQQLKLNLAKKFKTLKKLAKIFKPFVPKLEYLSLMRIMKHWKVYEQAGFKGFDVFLQNAPCIVVVYAESKNMLTQWEAGIVSYNIIQTAGTLGIGSQLLGYLALSSMIFKSLKKACFVPKKHKIIAALLLGYPDIKYLKTVDRDPLDINRY